MIRFLLASAPLIFLIFCLTKFKLKAKVAGFLSYVAALVISWVAFGGDSPVLFYSSLKGLSLTFYVVSIIWTSTFMFKTVQETGEFHLVSRYMGSLTGDRLVLGILISWCLAGVIQGIAGYGVPVAVCAPLMVSAGYDPVTAVTAVLLGHSWSVTFGSMGSSFYTLLVSTGYEPSSLAKAVGGGFVLPTLLCGLSVAHLLEGAKGLKRMRLKIIVVGFLMGLIQWGLAVQGFPQVATILSALSGTLFILFTKTRKPGSLPSDQKASCLPIILRPYMVLLLLAVLGQAARQMIFSPKIGFNFPATITRQGFYNAPVSAYAGIELFTHPAPLVLLATLTCLPGFYRRGFLKAGSLKRMWAATWQQSHPTILGITYMVMMALVMVDSGMTEEMAKGIAGITGRFFPVVSPFLGLLGCFMTGSNTNSNVLFGAFQKKTAEILCINPLITVTTQTVGGSLGSAVAPAKVFLGVATVNLKGRETEILKISAKYCLSIVLFVGIWAFVNAIIAT